MILKGKYQEILAGFTSSGFHSLFYSGVYRFPKRILKK